MDQYAYLWYCMKVSLKRRMKWVLLSTLAGAALAGGLGLAAGLVAAAGLLAGLVTSLSIALNSAWRHRTDHRPRLVF